MNHIIDKYKYELLDIKMPGRYIGGEFGSIYPKGDEVLDICVSFPDLYEIGMSNQALKILYNLFNKIDGVSCERVFAPAPDFEELLLSKKQPLFSLETGKDLNEFDIITFTIGYELCLTNLLTMLDVSNIPIKSKDRSESDPIIIVGGPATTNPLPFGEIVDFVCVAEAEAVYEELFEEVVELKRLGKTRSDIYKHISSKEYIWFNGKEDITKRVMWTDFGQSAQERTHLPVPSIKPVQDHGVVEIMRGCPNGCRFCHAGVYYKPFRQKEFRYILKEVDDLVNICGYRNITLSSLSSGDYGGIHKLVKGLNLRYKSKGVSFSLPSLRVNSISLPLIEELSEVRKSGLTFALETPTLEWQRSINKEVPKDKVIDILVKAKERGWKLAKFYFMLGLPVTNDEDEVESIVQLIREIQSETKLRLNVNIGVFIPKPHTTYERSYQLTDQVGFEKLKRVKEGLKGKNIKVHFHSPFLSFLEGIFTRGDERVNEILINAYKKGARLDAWDEWINRDLWKEAIESASWDVEKEICRERDPMEALPWSGISLLETNSFRKNELEKSAARQITNHCEKVCDHYCGVCKKDISVSYADVDNDFDNYIPEDEEEHKSFRKVIFRFVKNGRAMFIPHLSTMTIIERAFFRSGIDVRFTEGFNPKPKLEFAHPLTMGISSDYEIFGIELFSGYNDLNETIEKLNKNLAEGFYIKKAYIMNEVPIGRKAKKLMALYSGSEYEVSCKNSDLDANELKNSIDNFLETQGAIKKDYEITILDNSLLKIKAMFSNNRLNNPLKMIEEAIGKNPLISGYDFKRITCYAKSKKGTIILFSDVK